MQVLLELVLNITYGYAKCLYNVVLSVKPSLILSPMSAAD